MADSTPTSVEMKHGLPWHKLTKEQQAAYPIPEKSLLRPISLSFLIGVPWLIFHLSMGFLTYLNTVWIGNCAYCMDNDGQMWWGLLTPIFNFFATFPLIFGLLMIWWSIFPTPEWRRNEMAGYTFALPFALFWLMLAWIAWDLHTWVEGSLGISDNYQFGAQWVYWTWCWFAIPVVGSIALAPLYFVLKTIIRGTHNSPPPPYVGELGSRILHEGDQGNDVSRLQELLNTTTNHNLAVDGNFGSQTKAALMEFESNNNLDPEGVTDKLALAILDKKEPNTMDELTELIDLILSIIDPHDKGESRARAESIYNNLMKTMPFNMRTSARMVWKERFGVNREVLEWWK